MDLLEVADEDEELLWAIEEDCQHLESYLHQTYTKFLELGQENTNFCDQIEGVLEAFEIYSDVFENLEEEPQQLLQRLASADELVRLSVETSALGAAA